MSRKPLIALDGSASAGLPDDAEHLPGWNHQVLWVQRDDLAVAGLVALFDALELDHDPAWIAGGAVSPDDSRRDGDRHMAEWS